jgi:WD40 repeat protein
MRRFCLTLPALALAAAGLCAAEEKDKPALVLNAGGHTAPVRAVFFRADGKELVSVAEDRTVRVWDVATGETTRVLRLPGRGEGPTGVDLGVRAALAGDGRRLAVSARAPVGDGYWVYLIDLAAGRVTRVLKGFGFATALAWSPDGAWLASGSRPSDVRLWDAATGEKKLELPGPTGPIPSLAFAPDGRLLAGGGHDGTVRLWSVPDGKPLAEQKRHDRAVVALAWSPDGKTLASRAEGQQLFLWKADGTLLHDLSARYDGTGLAFSPTDPQELLGGACLLNLANEGRVRSRLRGISGIAPAVALARDGRAAWAGAEELYLWQTQGRGGKDADQRLGGRGRTIHDVGWAPDGKTVAWGHEPGRLRGSFDLADLKLGGLGDATYRKAQPKLGGLALERGGILQVDVKRGTTTVRTLHLGGFNPGRCLTFVGEGRAAIGGDSVCALYDTETGKRLRTYQGIVGLRAIAPSPGDRYLLAGGMDQTLHVWPPDHPRPLLSLFVAGSDWVAWTPEGYYAASPGGEKLVGWQVSQGPEQLATFYPVEQFRKTFYRPDVIRRLLEAGSLDKALALAEQAAGKPNARVEVEKVLPPKVTIKRPEAGAVVKTPDVEVEAQAESFGDSRVTALRLFVDDRPFDGVRGVRAAKPGSRGEVLPQKWTVPLASLVPGPHRLSVVAESGASKSLPQTAEIIYEPATGAATAAKAALPKLYVLAVGIDKYPGAWQLRCCANDAKGLAQAFADANGRREVFAEVETKTLLDDQATRPGILGGLGWLKQKAQPHDVAVFYYGGHGDTDPQGMFHLLTAQWAPAAPPGATVTGDELKKELADLPCRVVLLLEASHAVPAGNVPAKRIRLDNLASELTGEAGAVVLFAAGNDERSGWDPKQGHGFFTLALIEGLKGAADKSPKDGVVHLNELLGYVEYRGAELSKDEQHPTYDKPGNVRSFPLGACPRP